MKKVLFTATVDSHILHFHIPYLKMLKDIGYEVHVATNGTEDIPYCDKKHTVSFERSPFKLNNLKAIGSLKKIIDEEKFELIHCHTPMGSVVTRLAAKNARKNGTRVIYTAHGFHFYKGAPLLNWLLFYPIEKYLSKYTDTIITINKEDYERAKKKFTKTKIEYVPGVGVDPKKFDFQMTEDERIKLRKEVGCNKEDIVLIYVAELSKRKNQIMAIKTLRELVKKNDKFKLLLVGQGSLKEYYEKTIKEYGLENNIKLLGYRKDVAKLFKISDIAISTSRQEGLPVNIIEAIISGLLVVATDCRGNRDLIEQENIVNIDDYKGMAEMINTKYIKKKTHKKSVEKYIFEDVYIYIKKIYML